MAIRLARFGVLQMCSTNHAQENLYKASKAIKEACTSGCDLVCLPECFDWISENAEQSLSLAQPLTGPLLTQYRKIAEENNVWLSLGGFHELDSDGKMFNSHVIVDAKGAIASIYRKLHLFDAKLPNGKIISESSTSKPGHDIVSCPTPWGNLGLTTCYDVRFPTMYSALRFVKGCDIILVPSAFTVPTGSAHWHTLLKARAIETQTYVVAAAQVGQHNANRASYGHSLVVDPWGTVVAEMDGSSEGLLMVDIKPDVIADVRTRMPLQAHARWDVYGPLGSLAPPPVPSSLEAP